MMKMCDQRNTNVGWPVLIVLACAGLVMLGQSAAADSSRVLSIKVSSNKLVLPSGTAR